jgi:hypothetical protein
VSLDAGELAALRQAAALASSVPGVGLTLRHGPVPVLDVRPPPAPTSGVSWVCPHAFRAAVGRATALAHQGHAVGLRGLPEGDALSVDVSLPPCGRTFPGPVYDLAGDDGRWIIIATTAPSPVLACAGVRMADVLDDRVIDARLVLQAVPASDADAAVDVAQRLLGRLGALQVEAWLAAAG